MPRDTDGPWLANSASWRGRSRSPPGRSPLGLIRLRADIARCGNRLSCDEPAGGGFAGTRALLFRQLPWQSRRCVTEPVGLCLAVAGRRCRCRRRGDMHGFASGAIPKYGGICERRRTGEGWASAGGVPELGKRGDMVAGIGSVGRTVGEDWRGWLKSQS